MPGQNTTRIGFIGFGEVGQRFARDFGLTDGVVLSAYDIVFDDERLRAERLQTAHALGVVAADSAKALCAAADIVISAVTADQTEAVARATAPLLRAGQIFLDVNSAAPGTKVRAAVAVNAHGADYVEAAVMAAVLAPGIRVPILAGGPLAAATAARLNGFGMNMTPVSSDYGRASAIKLCRSIVIKGLEALMVDCAQATQYFNVEEEVYASLGKTYPSIDWAALAADMGERVATHGVRRAAEMREAGDMLRDAGFNPGLAHAVADAQSRGARRNRATAGGH